MSTVESKVEEIRIIEKLPVSDNGQQRAQLILVLIGEQPAADIFLYPNEPKEAIVKAIEKAGLSVRQLSETNEKGLERTILFVARTPEIADELMNIHPAHGRRTEHEAYARLMGFPQTAIDAFLGKAPMLSDDKVKELYGPDIIFQMRLSESNWKDEMEFLRKRSMVIKEVAPGLYDEIVRRQEQANASMQRKRPS